MGLIRFLLAAAVIIAHTTPVFGLTLTGPLISVEAFFIISGFYMAMILSQKYTGPGSYRLFITNRFLKLYPMYWIVALFIIAVTLFSYVRHNNLWVFNIANQYPEVLKPQSLFFLAATNLAIFGQDIVMFMGFDQTSNELIFTSNFFKSNPPVFRFLLIPQAWSLGVELTFYLVAPFLVRLNHKTLFWLICVSLLLRLLVTVGLGLDFDPWLNRFFPLELAFFLAGTLGYKLYIFIQQKKIHKNIIIIIFLYITLFTIALPFTNASKWFYYACFAAAIPFVFSLTKNSRLDGLIGDLSYPMYISHLFVLWLLTGTGLFAKIGDEHKGIATLASTVLFSILLIKVTKPIEEYRQKRAKFTEQNLVTNECEVFQKAL